MDEPDALEDIRDVVNAPLDMISCFLLLRAGGGGVGGGGIGRGRPMGGGGADRQGRGRRQAESRGNK